PSPLYSGERAGVRGHFCWWRIVPQRPLTLTLSPEYGGEGTRPEQGIPMNPFHHSRRHFLASGSMGIGSLALTWLLTQSQLRAAPDNPPLEPINYDLKPKPAHYAPRAKAMISLYMQGGPSHIDLFEPKPVLDKYNGQKFKGEMKIDSPEHYDGTLMA